MKDHRNRTKRASIGLVGLAVVLMLSIDSVGWASAEDCSYWAKATSLIPVRERWEFGFEQKLGFEDEARRVGHQMQDFRLAHTNADGWLKYYGALKILHVATDERDEWIREIRPHFNVTILSEH